MARRALISGAGGMLGRDLTEAAHSEFEVVALTREQLDITSSSQVARTLAEIRPAVVFNCAAWTDVDGAESASSDAHAVNGNGAGMLAGAAAASGAWIIHISSDYVFDGNKRKPYVESDPPRPLSQYGASKLAGEWAVAAQAPQAHTIVRASWLFGAHGNCFPKTILRLAGERQELAVVEDQRGTPTFTCHLAGALVTLARERPPLGLCHTAASGSCSWFEFAREIVARAGLDVVVKPIATAEMPRPARRPAYSVLDSERPDAPRLPHWREGLAAFMAVQVAT